MHDTMPMTADNAVMPKVVGHGKVHATGEHRDEVHRPDRAAAHRGACARDRGPPLSRGARLRNRNGQLQRRNEPRTDTT
jgi:hypothetical protein